MATQFKPNRLEVSDRFPMLGFTVRTDGPAKSYEIAIGTSPDLFGPEGKVHRTRSNFFSTRVTGPLPIERGEAVYVLPPEVLVRFIGQQKLYYALATFSNGTSSLEVITVPSAGSPYIKLSGLTGRSLQRVRLLPNRQRVASGYGARGSEMEWSGDAATPGTKPASPTAAKGDPVKAPVSPDGSASVHYDDGYGPLPPHLAPEAANPQAKSLADYSTPMEGDQGGIDGPVPDDALLTQGLAKVSSISPEYPQASRFEPANSGNYKAVTGARTIKRVVIHITDGNKNIDGTISWFQDPKAKVSAHYIVGQDGEVVQMVRNNDMAQHAHDANVDSIGIEHVARAPHAWDKKIHKPDPGLMPTQTQYCASADLVSWLCNEFNIPRDRDHIVGHSEVDAKTTHTGCPNAVWDWDNYMPMVTASSCETPDSATTQASALETKESFDENWNDVDVVGQPEGYSCWATAAALVVGWRDRVSFDIQALKKIFASKTGLPSNTGLAFGDFRKLADALGLVAESPACYTVEGLRRLLENYGPLWVGIHTEDPWEHAVVITGMFGDGSQGGTFVRITDPWGRTPGVPGRPGSHNPTPGQGSRYALTFAEFTKEYDTLAFNDSVAIQIIHAADTGGRTIEKGHDQSYALAAAASRSARTRTTKPNVRKPATGVVSRGQSTFSAATGDGDISVQPPSTTSGTELGGDTTGYLKCLLKEIDRGANRASTPRNISFVVRYLRERPQAGSFGAAEVAALSKAGLQVVTCYESHKFGTSEDEAVRQKNGKTYFTHDQGKEDAKAAFAQAQALGQLTETPIYFAVDYGDLSKQQTLDYFRGVQEGRDEYLDDMRAQGKPSVAYDIGVYSGSNTVGWCKGEGLATWFWQSMAWNYAKSVLPGVNIHTWQEDGEHDVKKRRCGGQRFGYLEGWGNEGGWTLSQFAQATPEDSEGDVVAADDDTRGSFRSSPADEVAVATAQGRAFYLPSPPGPNYRARTLGDSSLPRITGGEGNITWALDQYPGVKTTGAPAAAPMQSAETIRLSNWPYCEHSNGARSAAWFNVDWQYSGQALGHVAISPAGTQQGPYPLSVEARIEDGKSKDPSTASLEVIFAYRFSSPDGPTVVAVTELTLYSDGSIDQKSNWTARAAA